MSHSPAHAITGGRRLWLPYDAVITLVTGIVAALALLTLTVVGFADLAILFKTMRRDRAPVVSAQVVRAIAPQRAWLMELVARGKKMQAIKDLRAASGLGLDAMAAGHDISGVLLPRLEIPVTAEERARNLIAQGRMIQAFSASSLLLMLIINRICIQDEAYSEHRS